MGNHKSTLVEIKKNNNTNTEGTQGLITLNSEKNSKKNTTEILYKEKNRSKNLFFKRESVDALLSNNKIQNKNNINSIPTENNEIIKHQNGNNSINYNTIHKNTSEFKIFEGKEEENKNSENITKYKNEFKKMEHNNITIINNLSRYFPKSISKEEIIEMVNNILSEYIVGECSEFSTKKQLTKKQAEALGNIIYNYITNNNYEIFDYSLLDNINIKVGVGDLNKNAIEKMFFNGNKISKIQNDIIIKNLSKGCSNIKTLFIEIL